MTLHYRYDHRCPKCYADYIPFDHISCPNCGYIEEERFDFIPLATASMIYNLQNYGRCMPLFWAVSTFTDEILQILFVLFDKLDKDNSDRFREFVHENLLKINWGDRQYLRAHVEDIAVAVCDELKRRHAEGTMTNQPG